MQLRVVLPALELYLFTRASSNKWSVILQVDAQPSDFTVDYRFEDPIHGVLVYVTASIILTNQDYRTLYPMAVRHN